MKRSLSILTCALIFPLLSFSQTGTIKIAKPVKKDTVINFKRPPLFTFSAGANYTLKKNTKIGYEATVLFRPYGHAFGIGIEYCQEEQYYELSAYNKDLMLPDNSFPKSQNRSQYLKLPLEFGCTVSIGGTGNFYYALMLKPEYLLKMKNENNRLEYTDFNQFNLAGGFTFGVRVKKHYRINLTYSKDFFENIKDRNIYNSNGGITGKQKTKTNLLSFSVSYLF
jgi:hypothetical protein